MKGYRLNKFLHALVEPAHRAQLLADPEGAFAEAGLTDEERAMVRKRDWRALIRYGASFFMLEKLGAVVGVSNLTSMPRCGASRWRISGRPATRPARSIRSQARKQEPWPGTRRPTEARLSPALRIRSPFKSRR